MKPGEVIALAVVLGVPVGLTLWAAAKASAEEEPVLGGELGGFTITIS